MIVERQGAASVVRVVGEVDLSTVAVLHGAVSEVIAAGQGPVVVDLARVGFLSSTGVLELLQLHEALRAAQRPLRLAAATQQVRKILPILGVDREIEQHATVAAALLAPLGEG